VPRFGWRPGFASHWYNANRSCLAHRSLAASKAQTPTCSSSSRLKDEYFESDLEAALIAKIESFLLGLDGDFTFVGRQRPLRRGDAWYRTTKMRRASNGRQ
jgi:predicted nuclease of restriction endonuclease-like (RecB) superfamily